MRRLVMLAVLCLLPLAAAQEAAELSADHLAKLMLGEGEEVELFPGALPDEVTVPLPKDSRLFGSATIGEERSIVALELQGNLFEVERMIGETLLAAGWHRYNRSGPSVFSTAQAEAEWPPFADYCNPERTRTVSLGSSHPSGAALLILLNVYPYCRDAERELAPLPSLMLPAGVNLRGESLGQSGDSFGASVSYTTNLTSQAIFDDLVSQLEVQGWRVEEVMQEAGAVSASLTLETEGERWRGLLSVTDAQALLQVAQLP